MTRKVEPSVFLVSETVIREGLYDYLQEIGNPDWKPNEQVSGGENLIEAAGRMCYRSWQPYDPNKPDCSNPNVTKVREGNDVYIKNILESKHGCYDSETDVLTSKGWINWTQIKGDEEFATLNQFTNQIEYQKATSTNLGNNYDGPMYQISGFAVNLLVTPNHNLYISNKQTKEGRKENNFELIPAYLVNDQNYCMKKYGLWKYNEHEEFSYHQLAFLGFAIGDGNLNNNNSITFHLRKVRKIQYLQTLCNLLNLDLEFNGENYKVNWPFDFTIYNKNKEKIIPQWILTNHSFESLEGLLEGLINSDGSISETGTEFITTSKVLAEQFQQLCLHTGNAANISQAESYKERNNSYGNNPIYVLHIITRNLNPEINRKTGNWNTNSKWIQNWSGKIYCVEVPNHTLYVKRNGKPIWCGNSVIEHVNLGFIFHNISRVFTHELVRHRIASYSQESLRYVRLDNIKVWFPEDTIIENAGQEALDYMYSVIDYLSAAQIKMAELFKIDQIKDFNLKKIITSTFRRIAPIGLATTIMMTANLRTWRWLIELRTHSSAEEEIRMIFQKVANLCKIIHPNVFQDMIVEPDDWYHFHNRKV